MNAPVRLHDFVLINDGLLHRGIVYHILEISTWQHPVGFALRSTQVDVVAAESPADQVKLRPCFGLFGSSHNRGELVMSAGNLTVLSLVDIGVEFSRFTEFAKAVSRHLSGEEAG